jgi:ectoine hydroxylase-related dioxygenase (phytanoyl-CoA dioxygenase family)
MAMFAMTGRPGTVKGEWPRAVDVVPRAGDVSIHHPNIIHGANANLSNRRRCGLIIRYIPTSTRILVGENECFPSAFLLRAKPFLASITITPGQNSIRLNTCHFAVASDSYRRIGCP